MGFTVEDLVAMDRVEAVAASPDGSWHAIEVKTADEETGRYRSAIWRVDGTGSAAPLLSGRSSYSAPGFRRDGALGFLTDRPVDAVAEEPEAAPGDDARQQVWIRAEDGAVRPLTDEPLGVSAFAFAREGDRLFVMASVLPGVPHEAQRETAEDRAKRGPSILRYTEGPVRYWDHWIAPAAPHLVAYDAEGEGRRDLTPAADREHRQASWDVSPDGRRVALTSARKNRFGLDDLVLLVIDAASGAARAVFDEPERSAFAPRFSPDGERLLCAHQRWEAGACIQERLAVVGVDAGARVEVAPSWDRWGQPIGWRSDDEVLVSADDRGEHALFAISIASGAVRRLPLPAMAGHVGGVVPAPDGFVGIAHGLRRAPDAFALSDAGEVRWLSSVATPALPDVDVESHVVTSTDGSDVQYWLVLPAGSARVPVVVWIHGGPIGAWNDQWHWRWNPHVLLARGYGLVLPNPRGSTGFGQAFVDGIWNNQWGAQCHDDLVAIVDEVAQHEGVDEERLVAMGGSFGGYMTNWIGGLTDRFVGLVTHASLWDLDMFASTTDHPAFWRFQLGADRWSDLEAVERYSPHRHAASWRTPTLILHGERDFRVPISEALALFDALQFHGVESELVVFPDENHWILKPRNVVAWYHACLDFIDRRTAT